MNIDTMPDIRCLRVLLAVADTGSFAAAGRTLGISQQAVSERIDAAEAATKLQLCTRTPRGSALTEDGHIVAAYARQIMDVAGSFIDEVNYRISPHDLVVRVASSKTVAEWYAPRWISRLYSHYPHLHAQWQAMNSTDVVNQVLSGQHTIGFIESPNIPHKSTNSELSGLSSRIISMDQLSVIVTPTHPWATRSSISPDELATTALVLREPGSGTRSVFQSQLPQAITTPFAEVSSPVAVKETVYATHVPGVVPTICVANDIAVGNLVDVRVSGITFIRPIRAVWRSGVKLRGASRILLDTVIHSTHR